MKIFELAATAYGGPAMIRGNKETAVRKNGWLREEEFLPGLTLC
jgi:chromate transport protein ChrA